MVGDETNVQDGVVLHALETVSDGQPVPDGAHVVDGEAYPLVFKSWIGRGAVVEPGPGSSVSPPRRYVPAGSVVTSQDVADKLPEITDDHAFSRLNGAAVHANTSFAEHYGAGARTRAGAEGGLRQETASPGEVAANTHVSGEGGD